MRVEGIVNDVSSKRITAKSGKQYDIWSADIAGTVVKFGFDRPSFTNGEHIAVEAQSNKWGELEVIKPGKPSAKKVFSPPVGAPASKSAGYTPKPFPLPKTHGDTAIIRQNALTNANATVAALVHSGAIQDGLDPDDMTDLVIEIAYKYADFSSGQREAKIVAGKTDE